MPHSALIELCEELDAMLHRIRSERKILRPIMRCRSCGAERRMAEPRVSVRAMILALGRFQIVPQTQIKKLEREWAKYRKQEGLDLYGKNESGCRRKRGVSITVDRCGRPSTAEIVWRSWTEADISTAIPACAASGPRTPHVPGHEGSVSPLVGPQRYNVSSSPEIRSEPSRLRRVHQ
jgi:hypothetical protein